MNEASTGTGVGPDLEEEQRGRVRGLVAELRSGQFRQARGYLARNGGFCCLGVACEVAMAVGFPMIKQQGFRGSSFYAPQIVINGVPAEGSARILPKVVANWFGLPNCNPMLDIPEQVASRYRLFVSRAQASTLNDDAQMTLPDIGECFQYTFLREDWEAEHAETAG